VAITNFVASTQNILNTLTKDSALRRLTFDIRVVPYVSEDKKAPDWSPLQIQPLWEHGTFSKLEEVKVEFSINAEHFHVYEQLAKIAFGPLDDARILKVSQVEI
jgi:hypothetical protein